MQYIVTVVIPTYEAYEAQYYWKGQRKYHCGENRQTSESAIAEHAFEACMMNHWIQFPRTQVGSTKSKFTLEFYF